MPFRKYALCLIISGLALLCFADACCHKVSIDYEIHPSGGSTGNILQCVMSNIVFSRAIRFNSFEGCILLDPEWNSNPTFESGSTYAWVTAYERQFQETNNVHSPIPDNFGVGSSVDVVFRTPSVFSYHWFNIDIAHKTTTERFLHMDVRPNWDNGTIILNNRENGWWGTEIHVDSPIEQGDLIYVARIVYKTNSWDIYINGSLLYSFEHRQIFTGDANVVFGGTDTYCLRIVFMDRSHGG